jgi:hypothetical protein
MKFIEFKKIPRLSREVIVTEKIDGSNGQIYIVKEEELTSIDDYFFIEEHLLARKDNLLMFAGSRNRWLQIGKQNDNMGFATWVKENAEELFQLGEGCHFGEYYGKSIQRGYGLDHKRFALFNVSKWANQNEPLAEEQSYCPKCCEVVPTLYVGDFDTQKIYEALVMLKWDGSRAVPGYTLPEGIIIFHTASGHYYKKTVENDAKPKSL